MRTLFNALGWLLVAAFSGMDVSGWAEPARVVLAENGKAALPIVISPNASDAVRETAAELAGFLGRMAGVTFEVLPGDGSRGIVLGTLADFPDASLEEPLAVRNTYDGKEAFAIRTKPNRLRLIGRTERGASHAAFRLLERLGCRWFFPSAEWEVVPSTPALSVSLDETDRPKILARRIWYGYGPFHDRGHPRGGSVQKDYEAWSRRNLMAGSFRVYCGHAWQAVIAANKRTFEDHPEYLALVKGERKGEQLCVSNPAVRELATRWALDTLAKKPDLDMVSMECSDGDGQCECERCAALGSVSDRVFGLANDVALAIAKKTPGKMVGCLAYNQHSEPPSFALAPNVYVQLTGGFIRGRYTHDELIDLWPKKTSNLGFYEYFSVWLWDFDMPPGGNGANLSLIRERVRRYAALGATSFDAESGNNWGVHGRGYYAANRLLWNPDADLDAILADFYERAFGPAASAMQRYYERLAPDSEPLVTRSLIGEAFRDVDQAARLAAARPDVLARLDQIKHYLRYVHLRWLWQHEKEKAKRKELAVATMTHAYRTRYEYMNHWAAMRSSWADALAKEHDEPTWRAQDRAVKPWQVDAPVTAQETAKWFREGLEYFVPTLVTKVEFSNDLAPGGFTDGKPADLVQSFQRPAVYALFSRNCEPIDLTITTGVIAWYRDRAETRWRLRDRADAIVAEGRLPLDGQEHPLSMKVPAPGVYFFECDDFGAGWRIRIPADRPAVLVLRRNSRFVPLGQIPRLFFYVPKGTKTLDYYWRGGPHRLLGPDGKPVHSVEVSDEIVRVEVPPGLDGQCWSFSPCRLDRLWFFNAPNGLASSPETMLVPTKCRMSKPE